MQKEQEQPEPDYRRAFNLAAALYLRACDQNRQLLLEKHALQSDVRFLESLVQGVRGSRRRAVDEVYEAALGPSAAGDDAVRASVAASLGRARVAADD